MCFNWAVMTNTLYYGDNLDILREHVPDESVDLVYLDPPFNSNASYNVLFKEQSGEESPAQIRAFNDTWQWTQESQRTFENEIMLNPSTPANVREMIDAFRQFIGSNAMMAYLVMMTPRLVELRRVLKPTGSIYLHCDPTASQRPQGDMIDAFTEMKLPALEALREPYLVMWAHGRWWSLERVHDTILNGPKTGRGAMSTWTTMRPHRMRAIRQSAHGHNLFRFDSETGKRLQE